MENPQFMVLDGASLDTISAEDAARALAPTLERLGYLIKRPDATTGPIKPPPEVPAVIAPKPVAGHPRTQVGTRLDKDKGILYSIFVCTGMPDLIEVVSQPGQTDAYVPRAYNWGYDLLPGVIKPIGPETSWGLDPVPGSSRPAGYRTRYFPDGRAYYEQSELPDEVYVAPTKPVSPISLSEPVHHELSNR